MTKTESPASFEAFTRWIASSANTRAVSPVPPEKLVAAARAARDEMLRALGTDDPRLEVLHLLAAATLDDGSRLPELTTAKGFRVTLAYDDGGAAQGPSICVLVQCPSDAIDRVQGQTAYLWNGTERFELGQFDIDGKAIGTLPAGIEVTLSDFAMGRVKLEEPGSGTHE